MEQIFPMLPLLSIRNIRRYPRVNITDLRRIFVHFQGVKRGCIASYVTLFTTQKINKKTSKLGILFAGNRLGLALSLLLLAGCAEFNAGWNGNSGRYNDPYAQSNFDDLLGFGANMANIPPSSRAKICHTLLKGQKESPGVGIQLHLMVGRLLSDACGDIPRILDGVASIPPKSLYDERMRRFVDINTEALKRLQTVSRKTGSVERKQKTVQSVPESKDATESKKDETRLLREKLEAIRSMEKHLDESESGGAN
jgi:hypothetical protein